MCTPIDVDAKPSNTQDSQTNWSVKPNAAVSLDQGYASKKGPMPDHWFASASTPSRIQSGVTLAYIAHGATWGDNLAIFGQSVPQADIIISVNSEEEFFGKIVADSDGIYLYNFDTILLDYGSHTAKSKASIGNQLISGFSYLVSFKVGTKNVVNGEEKEPEILLKGDPNNDGRVNLVDFSIAAYWYKKSSPPANVDLNSDGKVDLIDFSIMAYYWTG